MHNEFIVMDSMVRILFGSSIDTTQEKMSILWHPISIFPQPFSKHLCLVNFDITKY